MNEDMIITAENTDAEKEKETERLKAELEALRSQIARSEKERSQRAEFLDLFPDVGEEQIPEEVYKYAKESGASLAASYAVYHRKLQLAKEKAEKRALETQRKSPGPMGGSAYGLSERLFTTDEIRAMSADEVKRNYKQIMKSLKNGK